jgi:hypothetical protein
LQFIAAGDSDDGSISNSSLLQSTPQLHKAPAASVDINPVREVGVDVDSRTVGQSSRSIQSRQVSELAAGTIRSST